MCVWFPFVTTSFTRNNLSVGVLFVNATFPQTDLFVSLDDPR